jgi:hypothetical protein
VANATETPQYINPKAAQLCLAPRFDNGVGLPFRPPWWGHRRRPAMAAWLQYFGFLV